MSDETTFWIAVACVIGLILMSAWLSARARRGVLALAWFSLVLLLFWLIIWT